MANESRQIFLGASSENKKVNLELTMANRHGLISGATGTGKTVTLQLLAENFAKQGIPVFTADIKGDLSGIALPSNLHAKVKERLQTLGIDNFQPTASAVCFWDLFSENGIPIRSTVSEFGPVLLSRLLELNEVQTGVLQIAFRVADDEGLLLIDTKDLRSLLSFVAEEAKEIQKNYGNVSANTIGAIQRKILVLEEAGADRFFAEPAISLKHFMRCTEDGRGIVNILDATKLINDSKLYGTFLLWLLSELFEELPEVGDLEKPKLVFFFDEAHLLFSSASTALIERIETLVRLIRSKGVGVYFVTQSPKDIPVNVLGQLGNRIQHALRAFTPADSKTVRVAAENFRPNPKFLTEEVITELGIGEALVSTLDIEGKPQIVERTLISPPASLIGAITAEQRKEIIDRSPLKDLYSQAIDKESAYEILLKRREDLEQDDSNLSKKSESKKAPTRQAKKGNRQGFMETFFKSVLRSFGNKLGNKIVRDAMGIIIKSSR